MRTVLVFASFLGGLMVMSASVTPASAGITCQGPNQIIEPYGVRPSLYCEDEYLAEVALGYGMGVSGDAIRESINKKVDVCRLVGYDVRVQNICETVNEGRTNNIRRRR